ncbi:MAG: SPFH domain-containing protein [bacterium]
MGTTILIILIVFLILFIPKFIKTIDKGKETNFRMIRIFIRIFGIFLALILVVSTSVLFVGENETGHLVKNHFGRDLKNGAIIAANGEKGPQSKILPPGFHSGLLLKILYNVTNKKVVEIQEGHYGYLIAHDGQPLRPDQTYADAFTPEEASKMVSDAAYFLTHNGQKGPQTSILTPGKYRLNLFLWDVKTDKVTEVPEGFVGVIKSNVHSAVNFGNLRTEKPTDCSCESERTINGHELAVPLVPVGCIGVWEQALNPGKYYINQKAYNVTLVDTRVQTWEYKGGYLKRAIDLKVDQKGEITMNERSEKVEVPKTAADQAVSIVVEGWGIHQELRALVQVTPENAPFVIASVGGLEQIEDRIITPAIRSVLRNVVGGTIRIPMPVLDKKGNPVLDKSGRPVVNEVFRKTKVLDLIEIRDVLEQNVEEIIRPEGLKAGVDIKEIRFGDPVIPPEILATRQREQLAQQLKKAFIEERTAQTERIATEQAKATADQQHELVDAQIEVKRSEQFAIARRNEGKGERDKLNLIAEGQRAQANVLGENRVVELRKFEFITGRTFDFFEDHPDVLTTALTNAQKFVPERVFTVGENSGANMLAGVAGILGDLLGGERAVQTKTQFSEEQQPH